MSLHPNFSRTVIFVFRFELHLDDPFLEEISQAIMDEIYEIPPSIVMLFINLICTYKDTQLLDPCVGNRIMSNYLSLKVYNIICRDMFSIKFHYDFLVDSITSERLIVCHPPISQENSFSERCFEVNKPAILMSSQSLRSD